MRIRQIKGEVDGEIVDEASMFKAEKALSRVGVAVREIHDGIVDIRRPTEILDELAKKFQASQINAEQLSIIMTDVAGQRQGDILAAMLQNWDIYAKAMKDYSEGTGSAFREAQKDLESWQGKLNVFKNSWLNFVQTSLNSELFKGLLDAGIMVLNVLKQMSPLLVAIGKSLVIPLLSQGIVKLVNYVISNFPSILGNISQIGNYLNNIETSTKKLTTATNGLKTSVDAVSVAFQNMGNQAEIANQKGAPKGIVDSDGNLLKSNKDVEDSAKNTGQVLGNISGRQWASAAMAAFTTGMISYSNSKRAESIGEAIGNNMTTGIMSGAFAGFQIGGPWGALIGGGAGLAVSSIGSALGYMAQETQRTIDKADKLRQSFDNFNNTSRTSIIALESLKEEFKKLSNGVNQYGQNISLSEEEYQRYKEIVNQIVELSPNVIKAYDSEGNAIVDKNNLLENTIDLLEKERIKNLETAASLENTIVIIEGVVAARQKLNEELYGKIIPGTDTLFAGGLKTSQGLADNIKNVFRDSANAGLGEAVQEVLGTGDGLFGRVIQNGVGTHAFISDNDMQRIVDNYKEIMDVARESDDVSVRSIAQFNAAITAFTKLVDQGTASEKEILTNTLSTITQAQKGYDDLTKAQQLYLSNTIDIRLKSFNPLTDDPEELQKQIEDFTKTFIKNKKVLEEPIEMLFTANTAELTASELIKSVRDNVKKIADVYGQDENQVYISLAPYLKFTQEDYDNIKNQLINLVDNAQGDTGEITVTAKVHFEMTQEVERLLKNLPLDDLKQVQRLLSDITNVDQRHNAIRAFGEFFSNESLIKQINNIRDAYVKGEETVVNSINAMHQAFINAFGSDNLGTDLEEFFNNFFFPKVDDIPLIEFSDLLKETTANISLLDAAQKEMDSNGEISIGTWKALEASGLDYKKFLDASTGSLKLNVQGLKDQEKQKTLNIIADKEYAKSLNDTEIKAKNTQLSTLGQTEADKKLRKEIEDQIEALKTKSKANQQEIDLLKVLQSQVDVTVNSYKELTSELRGNADLLKKARIEMIKDGSLSSATYLEMLEKYGDLMESYGQNDFLDKLGIAAGEVNQKIIDAIVEAKSAREKTNKGQEDDLKKSQDKQEEIVDKSTDKILGEFTDLRTNTKPVYNGMATDYESALSTMDDSTTTHVDSMNKKLGSISSGAWWSNRGGPTSDSGRPASDSGGYASTGGKIPVAYNFVEAFSEELNSLHPELQKRWKVFLQKMVEAGFDPAITSGVRPGSYESKGKTGVDPYNSMHNYGMALDFNWKQMLNLAEKMGMTTEQFADLVKRFASESKLESGLMYNPQGGNPYWDAMHLGIPKLSTSNLDKYGLTAEIKLDTSQSGNKGPGLIIPISPQWTNEGNASAPRFSSDTDIAAQIFNFFKSKGLSDAVATAILGNLKQESGLDPSSINSLGYSGLAQWGGGRLTELKKYAESIGKAWTDLGTQLEFLWNEMNSKDIDSRMRGQTSGSFLTNAKNVTPLSGGFNQFLQLTDVEAIVRMFEATLERSEDKPNSKAMNNRINYANEFLDRFSGLDPLAAREWTYAIRDGADVTQKATEALKGYNSAVETNESKMQKEEQRLISLGQKADKISKMDSSSINAESVNEVVNATNKATDAQINLNNAVQDGAKRAQEIKEEMKEAADSMNALVNGNVDYNKRPYISSTKMQLAGWSDFPTGEMATTYTSGYDIDDMTVVVTPILDNGKVLTPAELDAYVRDILSKSGDILADDAKNLNIVIAINPEDDLEDKLIPFKEKHLELWRELQRAGVTATNAQINAQKELGSVAQNTANMLKAEYDDPVQEEARKAADDKIKADYDALVARGEMSRQAADELILYEREALNEQYSDLKGYNDRRTALLEERVKQFEAAVKQELKYIEDALADGNISEEEALARRKAIIQAAYGDSIRFAEQFNDEMRKINQDERKLREDQLSAQLNTAIYDKDYEAQLRILGQLKVDAENSVKEFRLSGAAETDALIQTQLNKARDYSDKIVGVYDKMFKDQQEKVSRHLSILDTQIKLLDTNDLGNFQRAIDLTGQKLQITGTQLEYYQSKLKDVEKAFLDGKIGPEEYIEITNALSKAIQDATLSLKDLQDQVNQMNLDKLNKQKDAIMDVVGLVKQMIQQEVKDQVEAIQTEIKGINERKKAIDDLAKVLKNNLKKEKEAYNDRKKMLQDELKAAKEAAKEKTKLIEDELKAYKKIIDAKKELLDQAKNERDYEQELDKRTKAVSTIQDRIAELLGNDSQAAIAERAKLQKELAEKQLELDNFVFDNSIKRQKEALDSEYNTFAENKNKEKDLISQQMDASEKAHQARMDAMEAEMKAREDVINMTLEGYDKEKDALDKLIKNHQDRIDDLNKSIANSGTLTQMAMDRIDERGEEIYKDLLAWNKTYGTGIDEDVTKAWKNYTKYVEIGVIPTLENVRSIYQDILDLSNKISSVDLSSQTVGVRNFFESQGYNVGWNDATKQFSVGDQWFDSSGFNNVGDRLYGSMDDLMKMLDNLPRMATGGIVRRDTLAKLHENERVLKVSERESLDRILPDLQSLQNEILNGQNLLMRSLGLNRGAAARSTIINSNSAAGQSFYSNVEVNGFTGQDVDKKIISALEFNNRKIQRDFNFSQRKAGLNSPARAF